MSPKETVIALYSAYASRDPGRMAGLLHKDVVWVAPGGNATQVALGLGSPNEAGAPTGANNLNQGQIVQFMAYNFPRFFRNVKNEFLSMISEGNLVITEHRMSSVLPNGRSYVNDYCFAYEVQGGQVLRIREYMDTRGGWAQVFGNNAPAVLLKFIEGPLPAPVTATT
jgi:ketosteroid isomerase-like protein